MPRDQTLNGLACIRARQNRLDAQANCHPLRHDKRPHSTPCSDGKQATCPPLLAWIGATLVVVGSAMIFVA